MTKLRSAICLHPSRMWSTVARGESCIKVKNSFAPVIGRSCSQVTSCMLSRKASPRIASDFAARTQFPLWRPAYVVSVESGSGRTGC